MDKNILMKITSLISVILTIYIIFIWEPLDKGEEKSYNITTEEESKLINAVEDSFDKSEILIDDDRKINVMIDDLTEEERDLFKVTINKLSVTDINTIEKIIEANKNSYGISEVLAFLEIRLSEEDYIKIDNIFIKEVDIIEEINVES